MPEKKNLTTRRRLMKKSTGLILGTVGGGVALGVAGFMHGMSGFVMNGKRQTLEEAYQWQTERYDTTFYENAEKIKYEVEGDGGYILHAELLKNPEPTTKYIILTHGYSDNRMGALKYSAMYLKLGFNCLIYDLRGHGENAEHIVTYGILEAADLNCLIKDTRARYPELTVLGLHGESLGAATSVTCMKYKPEVDFVVADCGFADIENVFRHVSMFGPLSRFTIRLTDLGVKLRYHYTFEEMRPIDALDENEIPILFIHGEEDDFILPENSKRMFERTKGVKELHIIHGAVHAGSVLKEPALYEEYVKGFLSNLSILAE